MITIGSELAPVVARREEEGVVSAKGCGVGGTVCASCDNAVPAIVPSITVVRFDVTVVRVDIAVVRVDSAVVWADIAVVEVDIAVVRVDIAVVEVDIAVVGVDIGVDWG